MESIKFSVGVFEKGRENLLRIDAVDGEYTTANCGDALEAYKQFWELKRWLLDDDAEIYNEDAPAMLAVIRACMSFLRTRTDIAVGKKRFPWNDKSWEQYNYDLAVLNTGRDKMLNRIKELA